MDCILKSTEDVKLCEYTSNSLIIFYTTISSILTVIMSKL